MPFVDKNVFLCSFVCFVDDKRILIYGGGTMKTGNSLTQRRRGREGKAGEMLTTKSTKGTKVIQKMKK